jgi:hypothetical protein
VSAYSLGLSHKPLKEFELNSVWKIYTAAEALCFGLLLSRNLYELNIQFVRSDSLYKYKRKLCASSVHIMQHVFVRVASFERN